LKNIRRKKQKSNVILFLDLLKYIFAFFLIIIIFSAYYNRWGELGFIAGLLTVALGWALQKPISGVVAWLIIVTRRPFFIGDRIIISGIKGDISNLTLTHIYLDEVGGTILGEEKSRRTIMVPNSIIFEEEVVNYTHADNYILDEVTTSITYESNLEKAEKIILKSVEKIMKPLWEKFPKRIDKKPHTRLKFKDSGIDVTVRYNSIAKERNKISTNITREIFNSIRKNNDVEIAYPHTEVVFREKKLKKT
jgi:small-conductance mechanosensitive channel